jgi:limonene-1,2-epoxide hydrolase
MIEENQKILSLFKEFLIFDEYFYSQEMNLFFNCSIFEVDDNNILEYWKDYFSKILQIFQK